MSNVVRVTQGDGEGPSGPPDTTGGDGKPKEPGSPERPR